jgi:hypothetical protein
MEDAVRMGLTEIGWKVWSGIISLRIESSGGLL